VAWELVRSDLHPATKKATLLEFDRIFGLGLADWQPPEEHVPAEILELVEQRRQARAEKRWKDADALRSQVSEAGFEIEDRPDGVRVKRKKLVVS
jgi:cysteinyl-tRNA synthetase